MLRIGIVGAGYHAQKAHLPALERYIREHPGAACAAAVCDPNLERARTAATVYGIPEIYETLDAMLAGSRPDAVLAITPYEVTGAVASKIMGRGLPLLMEKPPGSSVPEGESLCALAAASGVQAMVSVNRRFSPMVREAHAALVGRAIQYCRASIVRAGRRETKFVFDAVFHPVDTLRFLVGEVSVDSIRHHDKGKGRAMDLAICVGDGVPGVLEVLPDCGDWQECYEFFGPGLHAQVHAFESFRLWEDGKLVVDRHVGAGDPDWVRDGTYAETEAFVGALVAGQALAPTPIDVLPTLKVVCGIDDMCVKGRDER